MHAVEIFCFPCYEPLQFPRQSYACRRALSLSVVSAPQRRRNFSVVAPRVLGLREDCIQQRAMPEVGQGGHTTWCHALGGTHARGWCAPPVTHLPSSFWLPSSSGKIR